MFYIKVNQEGIITDCIDYPHVGYVEYDVTEIPQGIGSGYYKLIDGKAVVQPELKHEDPRVIESLVNDQADYLVDLDFRLLQIELGF